MKKQSKKDDARKLYKVLTPTVAIRTTRFLQGAKRRGEAWCMFKLVKGTPSVFYSTNERRGKITKDSGLK